MKVTGTTMSMIRGDSESITVIGHDGNDVKINLVDGDKVYFTVKKSVYATDKVLQKVITSFVDGTAIISITPDDTRQLKFGTYKYDIQLNRADGTVTTLIPPSDFNIDSEVTYE